MNEYVNLCIVHCLLKPLMIWMPLTFSSFIEIKTNKNYTNVCYDSILFKCLRLVTTFSNAIKRTGYFINFILDQFYLI